MILRKLGDFCIVKGGKRLPKGHNLAEFKTNHRYIRARDIKGGIILNDNEVYIESNTQEKIPNYIVNFQDVVITIVGANIGDSALIPNYLDGANLTENAVKLTGFDNLNPRYLIYVLQMNSMIHYMQAHSAGAAQDKLGIYKVRELMIPYQNLSIQGKIANTLKNYDDSIENNNQRIQLLEEMPMEIYKEWFVRLRFPNYEKFEHSELKKVKLRQCLSHYIGGGWGEETPQRKHTMSAHVIRGTDFPNFNKGKLNLDVLRYHKASNLSSRICKPNDIIFEVSGGTESQSLGRTCFMSESAIKRFDAPVICASFCKLMRVDSQKVSPYYIYELLNRMHDTGELAVFQVQSTGISNYQFENFIDATKVSIPPTEVQEKFDAIVAPMYDEIQLLGAKNQVLQEIRDLLLPRLISGKLSVEHLLENEPLNMAAEPQPTYSAK